MDYKLTSSVVKGHALRDYFLQHVTAYTAVSFGTKGTFWVVTTELKAFKRLDGTRVAALKIPIGATVYAARPAFNRATYRDERKMRASKAIVHGIYSIAKGVYGMDVSCGRSLHDESFVYRPGATVEPKYTFSMDDAQCASGIHFFLNFNDAYLYN